MKQTMFLLRVIAILILLSNQTLHAQLVPVPFDVVDMLSNQRSMEIWTISPAIDNPRSLHIKKVTDTKPSVTTTEVSTSTPYWWSQKVSSQNEDSYYEQFLKDSPQDLGPKDTTFGYVKVFDSETKSMTETWPVFLSVESAGRMMQATFTIYLSDNRIMEVRRAYVRGAYFLPLVQQVKIYKSGIDPASVSVVAIPKTILDVHILTTRHIEPK